MNKYLRTSFILYFVFAVIMVAWRTIGNFFNGVGIAFVGLIALLGAIIALANSCKHTASRTRELLITCSVFTILEFFEYFVFEFQIGTFEFMNVMLGIQNVISFVAIFLFAYMVLRFVAEFRNVKLSFIEALLGNREKKTKEVSNGSLKDKPATEQTVQENDQKQKEEALRTLFDHTDEQ